MVANRPPDVAGRIIAVGDGRSGGIGRAALGNGRETPERIIGCSFIDVLAGLIDRPGGRIEKLVLELLGQAAAKRIVGIARSVSILVIDKIVIVTEGPLV